LQKKEVSMMCLLLICYQDGPYVVPFNFIFIFISSYTNLLTWWA
jgi:hypothetical protein